jgi:hypothetical protein
MPDFQPHALDLPACREQAQELRALLDGSADLGEAAFRDFFEPRLHLRALVGLYNPSLAWPDRLAWEYPIFGDFRCDFAVGDSVRNAYTFVEYEDARPNSLFVKQGAKVTRAWSARFDGGYSQIIDWFYKLQVMTDTPDMEARFGKRSIRYTGVLVIGRDQHLDAGERLRLEWRQEHVVGNSKHVICVTYDRLLEDLLFRLEKYTAAEKNGLDWSTVSQSYSRRSRGGGQGPRRGQGGAGAGAGRGRRPARARRDCGRAGGVGRGTSPEEPSGEGACEMERTTPPGRTCPACGSARSASTSGRCGCR